MAQRTGSQFTVKVGALASHPPDIDFGAVLESHVLVLNTGKTDGTAHIRGRSLL